MKNVKTTDDPQEEFDLVNIQDQVIGKIKRGIANTDPMKIHRAIVVLLINNKDEVFLQKRSRTKDTYPGYWTASASGHVSSGQTYLQAAKRELEEELGIKQITLKRLGKILVRLPQETEFQTHYSTYYDGTIRLNRQEIVEGRFFPLDENFEMQVRKLQITPTLQASLHYFLSKVSHKMSV